MATNKTKQRTASVAGFMKSVTPEKRRADGKVLLDMMKRVTREEPRMWGPSIIGFGKYHYKYESGREGTNLMVGFSPRKAKHTIYIMPGFDRYDDLMSQLGKFTFGKCCLYVNKLEDVDMKVLEKLVRLSYAYMKKKYS